MNLHCIKTIFFNRTRKAWLFFLVLGFMAASCQENDVKPEEPIGDGTTTDAPANLRLDVKNIDKKLFKQLSDLFETINAQKIWNGFDMKNQQLYFVYADKDDHPIRGYIVNPHKQFSGMTKLSNADSYGMDIYSFDRVKGQMTDAINKVNGTYDLNYSFEGSRYHLVKYDDYFVESNQAATLTVHEVFHAFQGMYGADWEWIWGAKQDSDNYPLSKEMVALQVLSLSLMKDMPKITDTEKLKEYLKMYVAIRTEEMKLDPSRDKLVKNMANPQERGEGTANFVEEWAYHLTYDKNKTFVDFDPHNIESRYWHGEQYIHGFFTWDIWYKTGASAVYCLKMLGANIEQDMKDGKTPFDVAEAYLKLSTDEKANYLNRAKQEYDWNKSLQSAEKYMGFM